MNISETIALCFLPHLREKRGIAGLKKRMQLLKMRLLVIWRNGSNQRIASIETLSNIAGKRSVKNKK